MSIEAGQVYVIDYTLKSGGVLRKIMRCNGDLWEGLLKTYSIAVDVPPARTEAITLDGKNYTSGYYGQQDISSLSDSYAFREFWCLENAYADFKDFRLTGEYLPESNYPMSVGSGQVYIIDYMLKDGGIVRKLMRCDGDIFGEEGGLNTHAFGLD